jgi:hypothetical protein
MNKWQSFVILDDDESIIMHKVIELIGKTADDFKYIKTQSISVLIWVTVQPASIENSKFE